MIATIQFTLLVVYESITGIFMNAFQNMTFIPKSFKNKKIMSREFGRSNEKRRILFLIIALLPLALMCMFHSYKIGNDSPVYYALYKSMKTMSFKDAFFNKRYETGYMILVWVLTRIFSNPQWLFIVTGLFFITTLGIFIFKFSRSPGLTIILCVEMLILDSWLCINRATIAVGILLIAFTFLVDKKPIKFAITVLIATLFHNSALIFIITYPIVNYYEKFINKGNSSFKFELITLAIVLVLFVLFNILLGVFLALFSSSYYATYANSPYMNGQARISATINSILYFGMLFLPRILGGDEIKNCRRSRLDNTLFVIALINLGFTILTNRATLLARISQLFLIFAVVQYTETVSLLKNRKLFIIVTILIFWAYGLAITLLKTPAWQTTYPFIWFWQLK